MPGKNEFIFIISNFRYGGNGDYNLNEKPCFIQHGCSMDDFNNITSNCIAVIEYSPQFCTYYKQALNAEKVNKYLFILIN